MPAKAVKPKRDYWRGKVNVWVSERAGRLIKAKAAIEGRKMFEVADEIVLAALAPRGAKS